MRWRHGAARAVAGRPDRRVREQAALSDDERRLLPLFRKLNRVWDLGDLLAMRPAWGADEDFGEEFAKQAEERLVRLFGE